jgi:hypothetical protein
MSRRSAGKADGAFKDAVVMSAQKRIVTWVTTLAMFSGRKKEDVP